jgi:oxygen-independent coproporphyrinogen III oxidase
MYSYVTYVLNYHKSLAGIYIHIPFCKQACNYCNFHFSTALRQQSGVVDAIVRELSLRRDYLKNEKIDTIYIGGGTPSLLNEKQLTTVFEKLFNEYDISTNVEITLEANPDDLSLNYLHMLKNDTPINRLSIGIQSFADADLNYMNRAHNAKEAQMCIENALKMGFQNLTVDLIYGTPTTSHAQWLKNLNTIFDYKIPHISCYALTVEPKTPLDKQIRLQKNLPVSDEHAAEQFEILMQAMSQNSYIHYEISNFSKKDMYSKHNSNYWKGVSYLGVGPSAHSFDGESRQWNVANNHRYLKGIEIGNLDFEKEVLTLHQRYNEYVMTALRTIWGVDIQYIQKKYGVEMKTFFEKKVKQFIDNELVMQQNEIYVLTVKGKFLADGIAAELFNT